MARGRKLEKLVHFKRALKQKYGLGEGAGYKPWLRVQDVNSRGNSSKIEGLKIAREHHTLSTGETDFFYIAEFSDVVVDIREQFPLLPLDLSVKIAKSIGIEHPRIPNTGDLNVLTTDFLITYERNGKRWYGAFNVKPEDDLNKKRVAEKIDIERIWWELLGVPFIEFTSTDITAIQSTNIAWFTDPLRHNMVPAAIQQESMQNDALGLVSVGRQSLDNICDLFMKNFSLNALDAMCLLKVLLAGKKLGIDLKIPISSGVIDIQSTLLTQNEAANGY